MGYNWLTDKVGFGKYKDKTLHWVCVNDVSYMQWMINQENIKCRLECLPMGFRTIIQSFINRDRQSKIDNFEAWASGVIY